MKPIRIMIVDNHIGVRLGVKTYFNSQKDFELIAETSSGVEAISHFIKEKPDLVLMDLFLPDSSGIEIMRIMHQVNVRVPVIFLVTSKGFHLSETVMTAGAVCVVSKDVRGQILTSAIRKAMDKNENGSTWFRSSTEVIDKPGIQN
jgi:NarL family two-component system response regulator LiaR